MELTDITKLQKKKPVFKDFQQDIVLQRLWREGDLSGIGEIRVNIPQEIVYHSPTGFEWGYGGSGPSDLALNILYCFLDFPRAWRLHQNFKWEIITKIPREGGIIRNKEIRDWLKSRGIEI